MNIKYLIDEKWVAIKDYEGLYEVSNYGRIRSLNYMKKGIKKVLKCHARQGYYIKVSLLGRDGKRVYVGVHRLVALAFLPPPLEGQTQVDHISGDKRDNRAFNLRWCTPKGNMGNFITRKRLSEGHKNPPIETRQRMSERQKRRFQRERETRIGRYA